MTTSAQRDDEREEEREEEPGLRKRQGIPCFSRHVPCYFTGELNNVQTTTLRPPPPSFRGNIDPTDCTFPDFRARAREAEL